MKREFINLRVMVDSGFIGGEIFVDSKSSRHGSVLHDVTLNILYSREAVASVNLVNIRSVGSSIVLLRARSGARTSLSRRGLGAVRTSRVHNVVSARLIK